MLCRDHNVTDLRQWEHHEILAEIYGRHDALISASRGFLAAARLSCSLGLTKLCMLTLLINKHTRLLKTAAQMCWIYTEKQGQ